MKVTGFHGYFGGKNSIQSFIVPYIPKDIKIYCEPFAGSYAIYFYTQLSEDVISVYNDQNSDQVNLFTCSKNHKKLLDTINYHLTNKDGLLNPNGVEPKIFYKELYYKLKKSNFSNEEFDIPDYDRASQYAFLLTSAFSSINYMAAGYSGFNKDKLKLTTLINKLNNEYVQKKLEKITHIENLDFEEIIKKYDSPNTYFYCDPPYNSEKKVDNKWVEDNEKRVGWYNSKDVFDKNSHERLAKCLKNIQGKFSLSYYDFENLSQWFPKDKYKWVSKDFFRSSASFSENKEQKGTELLIMNYNMSDEEYQINYNKYNNETKTKSKTMAKKTKPSEELLDKVVNQIKEDFETGDLESVYELFSFVPIKNLEGYLPEEQKLVEEIKQEIIETEEGIIVKTEVKPIKSLDKVEMGPEDFGGEDFPTDVKSDDFWS